MSRFELLGAEPSEVAVAPDSIVEGIDVVRHLGDREFSVLVDLPAHPTIMRENKSMTTAR